MVNPISGVGFPVAPAPLPVPSGQRMTVEGVKEVAPVESQRTVQNDRQRPKVAPERESGAAGMEELDAEALGESVSSANKLMEAMNRQINFVLDDRIGRMVVKIIDGSSKEVIRQIPPEEMVALMARLRDLVDDFKGLLYNHKG